MQLEEQELQIARELEFQILEAQVWPKVKQIVREVTDTFIDRPLTEETVIAAQKALDERIHAVGPGFPMLGVRITLKRDPKDPYVLVLELTDE